MKCAECDKEIKDFIVSYRGLWKDSREFYYHSSCLYKHREKDKHLIETAKNLLKFRRLKNERKV